jgi:transposase
MFCCAEPIILTSFHKLFKIQKSHLSLDERVAIEVGLAVGKSMRDISKELKRSVSTISAKIRKGKYNAQYKATIADKRAIARRRKSHKHCKWRNENPQNSEMHFNRPARFIERLKLLYLWLHTTC